MYERDVGGCGIKDENDFYGVLGLKKECTEIELRSAYKKLAMRWHPDRCSAGENACVEEAKKKFQDIQEAYSVLSDSNKRFCMIWEYTTKKRVQGMGEFLNEMADMMQQNKPDENGGDTFENLQNLFQEMFQADIASFSSLTTYNSMDQCSATSFSFSYGSYSEISNANNKRNLTDINIGSSGFDPYFQNFCLGVGRGSLHMNDRSKRRNSRQTSFFMMLMIVFFSFPDL